jgi:site-specific recombinase XerD
MTHSIQQAGGLFQERRDLSPGSRKFYSFGIRSFLDFLTQEGVNLQIPITQLQESYFLKFARSILPREVTSREDISHLRTAYCKLSAIRQWLLMLESAQMHPNFSRKEFCITLKSMIPKAKAPERVVNLDDIARLVEFVRNLDRPESIPDAMRQTKVKAIILFLNDTGVRLSEFVSLYKRDIDIQKRNAKIYRRKGQVVIVSFSEETAAALCSYWKYREDGENSRGLPAFSGLESPRRVQRHISPRTVEFMISQICPEAGVMDITPLTFRHAIMLTQEEKQKRTYLNSP